MVEKSFTVDGEPIPTCPQCGRVVTTDDDGRINTHETAPLSEVACPLSTRSLALAQRIKALRVIQ